MTKLYLNGLRQSKIGGFINPFYPSYYVIPFEWAIGIFDLY